MSTILLVEARFYPHLSDLLAAIEAAGHRHETLTVPGALELPGAIALAARSGRFCAFVALGVVIRGETFHFEVVSQESARGLMELTMQGYAIGNGILTVENEEQARQRADPRLANKGGAAAEAALALFELRENYAP
jgi:6,7-dimethyl-8-ribityllumazine synthase